MRRRLFGLGPGLILGTHIWAIQLIFGLCRQPRPMKGIFVAMIVMN
jgi:hypothetical protein